MVINLFHVAGYKPNDDGQLEFFNKFGNASKGLDPFGLYCNGTSSIASCIDKLLDAGCTSFSVGYLGEITVVE